MTNLQAIDLLKGLEQSLDDYCELNDEGKTAFRMAITALELFGNSEQLPSAQPVRKTGQWIKRKKGAIGYNCSCCGKSDISNHFDYCPNCGADMRGEQE